MEERVNIYQIYSFRPLILLGILLSVLFLPSCNITKFLGPDESFVEEVSLTIINEENATQKSNLKDELEKFYQIKPINKSKSANYFKYKDQEDLGWIKRWLKKRSEKPQLLDTLLIKETSSAITQYLRNKKGYPHAKVSFQVQKNPSLQKSNIAFEVKTGKRYLINTIHHITEDSTLTTELRDIAAESLIRSGDPIDALSFDLEQQRIISEFQKRGYADFNLTHVEVRGDSSGLERSWDIFMTVLKNPGGQVHSKFQIGDIQVYTDFHKNQKELDLDNEEVFGKKYLRESKDFIVRPSTIDRKILFDKYDEYDSEAYYQTIRNLFSLEAYRFAKLSPFPNPKDSSLIDYKILLTPHNSKWILDMGLDAFFSNISRVQNDLVGVGYRVGIQDRNFLGGSEKFNTSIEMGIEVLPRTLRRNSLSLGLNNDLIIPSFTKPFNILRTLHKWGLITDAAYQQMIIAGKSKLTLGFNYLDILNFYTIFSINAGYGYDITFNNRHRVSFNQIGVNYTSYDVPPDGDFFINLMNPLLANSFQNTFFTGLFFKDLTHYYTSERGRYKSNYAIISSLKLSGLEVYGLNRLSNAISGKKDVWRGIQGTEFEKFVKLEFDARWYNKPRPRSQIAARFKTGLAIPFGDDRTISFVEQFFVGGPSSIRAWRPMHVGTGAFTTPEFYNPADTTIFFQRGDIVVDFSVEYRFDIFWYLEGALFLDGGNIWTLREDPNRPGSKISKDFLNQMALGYGYGFRFDFNYFLIRFDLGFKLRYPVPEPGESVWTGPGGQKFGNFNIAVNYPF